MKEDEHQALIAYRLKRAAETLMEAQLMQREEHWNTCANRLYYAAFYAVSALLAQYGYVASKHTGIKAMFNQHFLIEDQKLFLDEVNDFNLEVRYPEYRSEFYKFCTREFAEGYFNKIKEFVSWLTSQITFDE